jgi:hypothetical protein
MKSQAATVDAYLLGLPEERREVVSEVRQVILRHLPAGYRETAQMGMIGYEIPLERYPDTYNGQPLVYLALAAQKNHFALYLSGLYQDAEKASRFREAYREAGKKLDMGKACLRFKKIADLPLDLIGEAVAATPPEEFIAQYERVRRKA